jgi:hypothetical protein
VSKKWKRVKSRSQKETVIHMYLAGCSPKEISQAKDYYISDVEYIIHLFAINEMPELMHKNRALGHKSVPYYKTEDEMLKEPVYTYDSLSPSEKKIYDESRKNK